MTSVLCNVGVHIIEGMSDHLTTGCNVEVYWCAREWRE